MLFSTTNTQIHIDSYLQKSEVEKIRHNLTSKVAMATVDKTTSGDSPVHGSGPAGHRSRNFDP